MYRRSPPPFHSSQSYSTSQGYDQHHSNQRYDYNHHAQDDWMPERPYGNSQQNDNFNDYAQRPQPSFNSTAQRNPSISNFTSAKDPKSVHSRVFVGNLNTSELSKEQVANIFTPYGRIDAISMHKGYAFVQFLNVFEARKAVAGEDQNTYYGMKIDCNIVTEPKKPKQGMKRPPVVNSERSTQKIGSTAPQRTLVSLGGDQPPAKMFKTESSVESTKLTPSQGKDILICGQCKHQFSTPFALTSHKSMGCQLKFACKCKEFALRQEVEPSSFTCSSCSKELSSAWDLCVHYHQKHGLAIYKTSYGSPDEDNDEDNVLSLESDDTEAKK